MPSYVLAPWKLDADLGWVPPHSAIVGCVDLASVVRQAEPSDPAIRGYALFVVNAVITQSQAESVGGVLMGIGDCRELMPGIARRQAWESLVGFLPSRPTLAEWAIEALTEQADPLGQDRPLPMVPDGNRRLAFHLAGPVWSRRLDLATADTYRNRLLVMLRRQFRRMHDDDEAGLIRRGQSRRVLDYWCDKYGVRASEAWRVLLPDELRDSHPGPLPRETSYTDTFNRANQAGLGTASGGFTWAGDSTWNISANTAIRNGTGDTRADRAAHVGSDLSGDDHYAEASIIHLDGTGYNANVGAITRRSTSAVDFYAFYVAINGDLVLEKVVGGTATNLFLDGVGTVVPALGHVFRITSDGSNHTCVYDGVQRTVTSDSAITGNLRTGIYGRRRNVSDDAELDNFASADVGGGSTFQPAWARGHNRLIGGGIRV